jgi:hypothetical protein
LHLWDGFRHALYRVVASAVDRGHDEWVGAIVQAIKTGTELDLASVEDVDPQQAGRWPASRQLPGGALRAAPTDPDRAEQIAQSIIMKAEKPSALTRVAKVLAPTDPDRAARLLADAQRTTWATYVPKLEARTDIAETMAAIEPDRAEQIGSLFQPRDLR